MEKPRQSEQKEAEAEIIPTIDSRHRRIDSAQIEADMNRVAAEKKAEWERERELELVKDRLTAQSAPNTQTSLEDGFKAEDQRYEELELPALQERARTPLSSLMSKVRNRFGL